MLYRFGFDSRGFPAIKVSSIEVCFPLEEIENMVSVCMLALTGLRQTTIS